MVVVLRRAVLAFRAVVALRRAVVACPSEGAPMAWWAALRGWGAAPVCPGVVLRPPPRLLHGEGLVSGV